MTCPNCEYHKQRAARWRAEAYKQAGHEIELSWTGLTDEEIDELEDDRSLETTHDFICAIEAKLREKNT